MKRARVLLPPAIALALAAGVAGAQPVDTIATRVFEGLAEAREEAGLSELVRRDDLNRVAADRARRIAALDHSERLSYAEPISAGLERGSVKYYRYASAHLDMARGYADHAARFLRSWKGAKTAWRRALRPGLDAVGIAAHRAEDQWIILVAVLVDEIRIPDDLREMELEAIRAINRLRVARKMPALEENAELTEVARAHSEDMIRRGYFAHVSPDGGTMKDRITSRGVAFGRIAENIQKNQGYDDPVTTAVESWMESKGHRRNILTAEFRQTGMGVAMTGDGTIYFTQLFLTPRKPTE